MTETLVVGLAAFRLASLFVKEEGPFDVFGRVRRFAGVPDGPGEIASGLLPGVLSCMWCAGVWTALACWAVYQVAPAVIIVLAAATVVMLAERWVGS